MSEESTLRTEKKILLGNEAIAWGAIEAGLGFASAYPGTPSTEVVETLVKHAERFGYHVEWSVNEKVALEAAYGAAIMGVKSLVAMKHVGVNVAADPLSTSAYTGVEDSFVIISADDPSMWSSQNEQDNRYYGLRAFLPVLEPASVFEIKEIAIEAFKLSSELKHPVMLRSVTRLSHSRVPVELRYDVLNRRIGVFKKMPDKYAVIPSHARVLREQMLERWSSIEKYLNDVWYNRVEGDGRKLIITSGYAYSYVWDSLKYLSVKNIKILRLSGMIPLPRKLVLKAVEGVDEILVVEELEPIVETLVKSLLYDEGFDLKVHGKDYITNIGELTINKVAYGISKWLNLQYPFINGVEKPSISLPPRPPVLCPGCPHRGTFFSLKKAINRARVKPVYAGDIGCYSLGILKPFEMQDTIVEMGGSIGLANGMAHTLPEDHLPVAIIGDSTFFHSGVTPLINAVYNSAPMLVVVLVNRVTAMTGAQPHPGSGYTAEWKKTKEIKIDELARAIGVEYVASFDPFEIKKSEKILREAIEYVKTNRKVAVVIAKRACSLLISGIARRRGIDIPKYQIDLDKCTGCGICYNAFTCPAIIPRDDKKAYIDEALCVGCGECSEVCPFNAIYPSKEWTKEFEDLWW
jgi:indolepyruvate ferredoxin oxidoreductase alpha subunit